VGRAKLAGVLGLMAVFILGDGFSALAVLAGATLLLLVLCVLETRERFGAGEVPSPP